MSQAAEYERCPECGGEGFVGCGSAWHDSQPDNAPASVERPKWGGWWRGHCVTCGLAVNRCECEKDGSDT